MLFSDAHVKYPIRKFFVHDGERAARGHGRGDTDNLFILAGKLQNCISENILILRWLCLSFGMDNLAGFGVELAGRMILRLVLFRSFQPFALDRQHMEKLEAGQSLEVTQCFHKIDYIVAIGGAEVAVTEALEPVAAA